MRHWTTKTMTALLVAAGAVLFGVLAGSLTIRTSEPGAQDVTEATRQLLAEHYVGCGSLSWYPTPRPAANDNGMSDAPVFMAGRLPDGQLILAYATVDPQRPVYYTDKDGGVSSVRVRTANGTALLPDAPDRPNIPAVWQYVD